MGLIQTRAAEPVRWGILGTGFIAGAFAAALRATPGAQLLAVGSRAPETAAAFAATWKIPRCHPTYVKLAEDDNLDAIYVATPHALHTPNCILCLKGGKAVLCEKPLTINAREAEAIFQVAQAQKLLVMEAVWTRFIPAILQVERWIDAGAIGATRMVQATFGFRSDDAKLTDPLLGGGSLLDVGVYPLTIADLAFKAAPKATATLAHVGPAGVDEQAAFLLRYPGGGLAVLATAIGTEAPRTAEIMGSDGAIMIGDPFWCPTRVTLTRAGTDPITVDLPLEGNGYGYQARAFMEAYRAGLTECPTMPWSKTLATMRLMDAFRAAWGLRYPMEGDGRGLRGLAQQ